MTFISNDRRVPEQSLALGIVIIGSTSTVATSGLFAVLFFFVSMLRLLSAIIWGTVLEITFQLSPFFPVPVHLYNTVAPVMSVLSLILKFSSLHNIVSLIGLTEGEGLTVTFISWGLEFKQLLAVSVYTYVIVIGEDVMLVRISLILPAPLDASWEMPVTFARVHVNDVPCVALAAVYLNSVFEHIVVGTGVGFSFGLGLTVTFTS
jgi:hypothetical protein